MWLGAIFGAVVAVFAFGYGFGALLSRVEREPQETFLQAFQRLERSERRWGVSLLLVGVLIGIVGLRIVTRTIPAQWSVTLLVIGLGAAFLFWFFRRPPVRDGLRMAWRRARRPVLLLAAAAGIFILGWMYLSTLW